MELSDKIYRSTNTPISVIKNPNKVISVKSAPVPLSVLSLSFVYYLINSKFPKTEINLILDGSNPKLERKEYPYIIVDHLKSRHSQKGFTLLYVVVYLVLNNIENNKRQILNLSNILSSKLNKITQETYQLQKGNHCVEFKGWYKTFPPEFSDFE